MSADLPAGAVTAAQEYDLAHRDDADQPRWQTWSRVDDHQVTRLLAGALPELTAAIAARAAADERAACARLAEAKRDECVYLDDLGAMARSAYQDIADLIRARAADGAEAPGGAT